MVFVAGKIQNAPFSVLGSANDPTKSPCMYSVLYTHIFINYHFIKNMNGHMDNKVRNQGTGNVSFTGDSLPTG